MGPIVLPMAYGRTNEHLYLHGAAGNAMLRHAVDEDLCATVTIVDGLIVARSPFHNSMNYRSVVVRGVATAVEGSEAKRAALRLVSNRVVETWETGRAPTDAEIRRTLVLRVPLVEMSGKVRTGGPRDETEDLEGRTTLGRAGAHCLQVGWPGRSRGPRTRNRATTGRGRAPRPLPPVGLGQSERQRPGTGLP